MLTSQKLQLEMSEKRQQINALQNQEEYEVNALDALNKEYMQLEVRYQSALIEEAAEQDAMPTDDLDSEGQARKSAGWKRESRFGTTLRRL